MTNDQLETIGIRNDSYKVGYGIKVIYEVLATYSEEDLTRGCAIVGAGRQHARQG